MDFPLKSLLMMILKIISSLHNKKKSYLVVPLKEKNSMREKGREKEREREREREKEREKERE